MIVTAMIGCCGVAQGSRIFLGCYASAMFVLLIFTISCGVYILFRQNGIDVELSDALNYMVQHYYQGAGIVQEALDRLQQAFRCCGNAGCSDFRIFRQDPPRTCDIRCDGCHYRIKLALQIGFSVAVVVYGICMLAEVVAIAVALVLAFRGNPKYYSRSIYLYPTPTQQQYERQKIDRQLQSEHSTLQRSRSQGWQQRQRQYLGPPRYQKY
uniref:Tetraspanin n=1 Tax=Panagrolaimus superbus TaxID=310955 RepID=A0A914YFS1_9BILA